MIGRVTDLVQILDTPRLGAGHKRKCYMDLEVCHVMSALTCAGMSLDSWHFVHRTMKGKRKKLLLPFIVRC